MAGFSLVDFFNGLPGRWNIERHYAPDLSVFDGFAEFRSGGNANTLRYHEEGTLLVPGRGQYQSYREYIYRMDDDRLDVDFSDPHRADTRYISLVFDEMAHAHGKHLCGSDSYCTDFRVIDHDNFSTDVTVAGPAKNYTIHTLFKRMIL